jgi:TPR repeat protein
LYDLAVCYQKGAGVQKNRQRAYDLYKRAARHGDKYGQTMLGYMYDHGVGVPQNHTKAISLYRKAAKQGYALAQYDLAAMYANGRIA